MYRKRYKLGTYFTATVAAQQMLELLKPQQTSHDQDEEEAATYDESQGPVDDCYDTAEKPQETNDDQDEEEEETTSDQSEGPVEDCDDTAEEPQETNDDQDEEEEEKEEATSDRSESPAEDCDDTAAEGSSNDGNPSAAEDEDYNYSGLEYTPTEADGAAQELIEEFSEKLSEEDVKKEDIRTFVKKCVDLLKQCLKEDNMTRLAELLGLFEKIDDGKHEDYLAIAGKAMACNSYASVLLEIIEKKKSNDPDAHLEAVDKAWGLIIRYADKVKKMSSALAEEPIVEIMRRRVVDKQTQVIEKVDEKAVNNGNEDDNDDNNEENGDEVDEKAVNNGNEDDNDDNNEENGDEVDEKAVNNGNEDDNDDNNEENGDEVDEKAVNNGNEDDNDDNNEENGDEEDCTNELVLLYLMARDGRRKEDFLKKNIVELVKPFLEKDANKCIKTYAFLIITHIADEQKIKGIIKENEGMIKTCLGWVQKDLDKDGAGHHGLDPWEITLGIAKIAAIDSNSEEKKTMAQLLCRKNALGILSELLKKQDVKSQAAAALFLWNLAFDKEVANTMNHFLDLPDRLKKLKNSPDKKVKDNVTGALWMMASNDLANKAVERAKSARKPKFDLFISYCWEQQKLVKKLHKHLKEKKYKIWFDLNEMSGSTLDAMASAVETSSVVLICVSEKYKQSENCRTEAEYTFKLRKKRIPVLVQTNYEADGWLGFIIGTALYFDVAANFTEAAEALCKEIERKLSSLNS